jgi:hypothetical protein
MNKLLLVLSALISCICLQAQDTLPKFSVKNVGFNRVIIDWVNTFSDIRQISIQRSPDSLKNFKTIATVPDPHNPQNGYADNKAENDHMFYRLYILRDKGMFVFSSTKRPAWDTATTGKTMNGRPDKPSAIIPLIPGDSTSRGSALTSNRPKVEGWVPSKFVYTNNHDGYIKISLPEEEDKKYSIKFFTSDDKFLFELKDIKERTFKLDKTDFYRSGWFKFELYEDGQLKEKNKFFLPKEF